MDANQASSSKNEKPGRDWIDAELSSLNLGDERLNRRVIEITRRLAGAPTESIPHALEDSACVKAAYRLFNNDRVELEEILRPHVLCTTQRMAKHPLVLAIQDTTYLSYNTRPTMTGIGPIGKEKNGGRGIIAHSTLAITPDKEPLGLLSQIVYTRPEGKQEDATSAKKRPIEEKESMRWIEGLRHTAAAKPENTDIIAVADREADMHAFFAEAKRLDLHCIVRAFRPRRILGERSALWTFVKAEPVLGCITVQVPPKLKQRARVAVLEIRAAKVILRPPRNGTTTERCRIPLNAILAEEIDHDPSVKNPIKWQLLTDLPVNTKEDAATYVHHYSCRWQIEIFHKVLKSGCRVEDRRLNDADRMVRYLGVADLIAWRLFWMTYVSRARPDAPSAEVITRDELAALRVLAKRRKITLTAQPSVNDIVRGVARLGGFLGRKSDGEPGIITIWRGWTRFNAAYEMWQELTEHARSDRSEE